MYSVYIYIYMYIYIYIYIYIYSVPFRAADISAGTREPVVGGSHTQTMAPVIIFVSLFVSI